jgi:hypothetical protein
MLTLPPEDNNKDNKDNNVPYKLEPNNNCEKTETPFELTLWQQLYIRKFSIDLEKRDPELVNIILQLQTQVFSMQNYLKSKSFSSIINK